MITINQGAIRRSLHRERHSMVRSYLLLVVALLGMPELASAAPQMNLVVKVTAPAAQSDVVELKNGGMVRGVIEEIAPGVSVSISPALGGAARTIPWSEIAEIKRGVDEDRDKINKTQTAAEPAVASTPTPTPTEPAPDHDERPGPGRPRIHIDVTRPQPITLVEITDEFTASGVGGYASGVALRPVCISPCDAIVDGRSGSSFFFRGSGFRSKAFTLGNYSGDLVARVKPGRSGLAVTGILLISLSGLSALGLALRPEHPGEPYDINLRPRKLSDWSYAPMGLVLSSGLVALVAGAIMTAIGTTRYKLSKRRVLARLRGIPARG